MPSNDDSMEQLKHRVFIEDVFARRRRSSLVLVITLLVMVFFIWAMFLLLPPVAGILKKQEQILGAQLEGMQKIPDLTAKLQKIENQMTLLTTESIDERLKTVEKAIHTGGLKPEDISTFVDIKQDVKTLKTYMFRDPKELVELKELQKNYKGLYDGLSQTATKDMLRSEIGTMQTIMTVSFTFFGILFTVLFGSWWFIGRKNETPTTPIQRSPTTPTAETSAEVKK